MRVLTKDTQDYKDYICVIKNEEWGEKESCSIERKTCKLIGVKESIKRDAQMVHMLRDSVRENRISIL